MFSSLLVPWQIGLPWDQVQVHCLGGLSGTCILPLSALALQHGATFCVAPLTGGGSQTPPGVLIQKELQIHHLL